MTARDELHRLVDEISEEEADRLRDRLARRIGRRKKAGEVDRAMDAIASRTDPRIRPLPDEAISRESIYD